MTKTDVPTDVIPKRWKNAAHIVLELGVLRFLLLRTSLGRCSVASIKVEASGTTAAAHTELPLCTLFAR